MQPMNLIQKPVEGSVLIVSMSGVFHSDLMQRVLSLGKQPAHSMSHFLAIPQQRRHVILVSSEKATPGERHDLHLNWQPREYSRLAHRIAGPETHHLDSPGRLLR